MRKVPDDEWGARCKSPPVGSSDFRDRTESCQYLVRGYTFRFIKRWTKLWVSCGSYRLIRVRFWNIMWVFLRYCGNQISVIFMTKNLWIGDLDEQWFFVIYKWLIISHFVRSNVHLILILWTKKIITSKWKINKKRFLKIIVSVELKNSDRMITFLLNLNILKICYSSKIGNSVENEIPIKWIVCIGMSNQSSLQTPKILVFETCSSSSNVSKHFLWNWRKCVNNLN